MFPNPAARLILAVFFEPALENRRLMFPLMLPMIDEVRLFTPFFLFSLPVAPRGQEQEVHDELW